MEPRQYQPPPSFDAFLERFWKDKEGGQCAPLAEYLALFPGQDIRIALEYLRFAGHMSEADGEAGGSAARVPARVGRFRILNEIGHGGQGIVFLAEDTQLGRPVALKILTTLESASEELRQRFRREAEAAARLAHPGICTVYEHGEHQGIPYIAMRYVEGETLARRFHPTWTAPEPWTSGERASAHEGSTPEESITGHPEILPPEPPASSGAINEVVLVVEQVARALHYAHGAGVIHRDIKPSNIIVSSGNEPVILDLGLARVLEADSLSQSGDLFGTPPYLSPEQLMAHRIPVDCRTDIYSLGVTLFEGLTLRRPFTAATRDALYHQILAVPAPNVRRINPAIPKDLAAVVATALEKDRDRRYATALDFAEDLRRIREHEPIRVRRAGPWVRVQRYCQRNPALALALFVIALSLGGALLATWALLAQSKASVVTERELRQEAERARARYELLADELSLRGLDEWADRLWPAIPENAEGERGMEGWLDEASRLQDRRHLHEAVLREVKAAAASAAEPLRSEEKWLLDRLDALVRDIRALPERMEEMERRLAFASTVMERTVREFYGVWQQIGAEVTPDRGFPEGMTLKPQVGLVPLGPDPESGYLEFALLASGVPPRRDSASGRLQIGEDSAIVLVLLPGGSVTIGCRDGDPGRRANEVLREELLKPFFLGKHEVTQAQWLRAMGKNQASGSPGGVRGALLTLQHPVENVSWDQCAEFCRRLDVALPSEAQWEYAGRAGTDSVFAYGNDPSCLEGRENLGDRSLQSLVIDDLTTEPVPWDDGFPMHAPVGSFPANRFGLHDMLGNVSEWCLDPYSATDSVTTAYEGAATDALAETDKRVWRGGNWQFGPVQARCARRDSHAHWSVIPTRGLRVARALRH